MTGSPALTPAAEPMWSIHQSRSTGLLYFFSRATGVTQWAEPDSFDGTYLPWMVEPALKMAEATATPPSTALLQAASQAGITIPTAVSALIRTSTAEHVMGAAAVAASASATPRSGTKPSSATRGDPITTTSAAHHHTTSPLKAEPRRRVDSPRVVAGAPSASDPDHASMQLQLQLQAQSPVAAGPLLGVTSTIADSESVSAAIAAAVTSRQQQPMGGNGNSNGNRNSNSNSNSHGVDHAPVAAASPVTSSPSRRRIVANVPLVDLSHLGPDDAWRQHVTDEGLVYYSNDETAATTWDRPACLGQLILEEDADVVVMVGDARATVVEPIDETGDAASARSAELQPDRALSGTASEAGRAVAAAAVSPVAEPTADVPAGAADPLRKPQPQQQQQQQHELPELFHESYRGQNGWLSTTDDEGYVYYVHEPTGTTQWERPEGFA